MLQNLTMLVLSRTGVKEHRMSRCLGLGRRLGSAIIPRWKRGWDRGSIQGVDFFDKVMSRDDLLILGLYLK